MMWLACCLEWRFWRVFRRNCLKSPHCQRDRCDVLYSMHDLFSEVQIDVVWFWEEAQKLAICCEYLRNAWEMTTQQQNRTRQMSSSLSMIQISPEGLIAGQCKPCLPQMRQEIVFWHWSCARMCRHDWRHEPEYPLTIEKRKRCLCHTPAANCVWSYVLASPSSSPKRFKNLPCKSVVTTRLASQSAMNTRPPFASIAKLGTRNLNSPLAAKNNGFVSNSGGYTITLAPPLIQTLPDWSHAMQQSPKLPATKLAKCSVGIWKVKWIAGCASLRTEPNTEYSAMIAIRSKLNGRSRSASTSPTFLNSKDQTNCLVTKQNTPKAFAKAWTDDGVTRSLTHFDSAGVVHEHRSHRKKCKTQTAAEIPAKTKQIMV